MKRVVIFNKKQMESRQIKTVNTNLKDFRSDLEIICGNQVHLDEKISPIIIKDAIIYLYQKIPGTNYGVYKLDKNKLKDLAN